MPKPTAFAPISKRKESCWKTVLRGPPGAGPDIHSGKADAFRFGRTYMRDDAHGPLQSRHIAPGRLDPASRAAGAGAGERGEKIAGVRQLGGGRRRPRDRKSKRLNSSP